MLSFYLNPLRDEKDNSKKTDTDIKRTYRKITKDVFPEKITSGITSKKELWKMTIDLEN